MMSSCRQAERQLYHTNILNSEGEHAQGIEAQLSRYPDPASDESRERSKEALTYKLHETITNLNSTQLPLLPVVATASPAEQHHRRATARLGPFPPLPPSQAVPVLLGLFERAQAIQVALRSRVHPPPPTQPVAVARRG